MICGRMRVSRLSGDRMMRRSIALASVMAAALAAHPQGQSRQIEWTHYGGDTASSKYSPADEITAKNVGQLGIAWQWEHGEKPLEEYGTVPYRFENQPLMAGGVLYVTTPYNNAAALDAETGRELWRFDSGAVKLGGIPGTGFKHRAPALWRDSFSAIGVRLLRDGDVLLKKSRCRIPGPVAGPRLQVSGADVHCRGRRAALALVPRPVLW